MTNQKIYCAAFGYGPETVATFLNSAAKFIPLSDIVLFTEEDSRLLALREKGVNVVRCRPEGGIAEMSPTAQRYFYFRQHLSRNPDISKILISDIRDVLFQGDPFDVPELQDFDFAYPLEERAIARCSTNSRWITARYGPGVLEELRGCIISCCGTVIGTRAGMAEYLDKMCRHLTDAPTIFGIDQGVHNFIVNKDPVRRQAPLLNGLSAIITLHYMEASCLTFDAEGRLLNYNLSLPRIVHQYDRILDKVGERFTYLRTLQQEAVA
jgi:hypothetical protein